MSTAFGNFTAAGSRSTTGPTLALNVLIASIAFVKENMAVILFNDVGVEAELFTSTTATAGCIALIALARPERSSP